MRHVRDAQTFNTLSGSVDDIDCIVSQHEIEEWCRRPIPAIRIGLCHLSDQRGALLAVQVSIIFSMLVICDGIQGREATRIEWRKLC